MRRVRTYKDGITTDENFSRRVQCGVEIFEHEVVTRIKTSDVSDIPERSRPRLEVTGAINATRDFVSKRSSEFRELDNFLKTVAVKGRA